MARESDYQQLFDRIAALREKTTDLHAADLITNLIGEDEALLADRVADRRALRNLLD